MESKAWFGLAQLFMRQTNTLSETWALDGWHPSDIIEFLIHLRKWLPHCLIFITLRAFGFCKTFHSIRRVTPCLSFFFSSSPRYSSIFHEAKTVLRWNHINWISHERHSEEESLLLRKKMDWKLSFIFKECPGFCQASFWL